MGRFIEIAKQIVDRHLKSLPRDRAFSKAKSGPFQEIVAYDKIIDEIIDRFQAKLPDEWQAHIGKLIEAKQRERDLIHDIETLEADGYGA